MKKINISIVEIIVVILISCLFYCTYKVYLKDLSGTGILNCNNFLTNTEGFNNYQGYSQSLIDQRHQKLDNDLKKFRNLDLPININDYGNKCQSWNTDPLDRFPNGGDSCKLNGSDAICMDINSKQTTCNIIIL